jgi:hypothetical protein
MSEFQIFSKAVHAQYAAMQKHELFVVDVEDIFASYLAAFPEGTDPIFRERTVHDCNCCKSFIRRLGLLVGIDPITHLRLTVWDNLVDLPEPYATVARTMQALVRQAPIISVFRTKERQYSHESNADNHEIIMWHHFYGRVADKHFSTTPDKDRGDLNTTVHVFKRGLEELTPASFETVIDLIESKSIYRGKEHLASVKAFQKIQKQYNEASDRDAFIWANVSDPKARFRNTVIGTLLTDLSTGVDLEDAVKMFESKVAPENYKRTSALITPKMAEQAVDKLKSLGLEAAVHRRFARISDVSINNVLWANRTKKSQMKDSGLMEILAPAMATKPLPSYKDAQTIKIEDFLKDVLPTATAMDLMVQNRHLNNFVSLTGSDDPARLFQWDNQFAWSYDGEVTDSIKEKVKRAGGNTEVPLRVSLAWYNGDDLDMHAQCPEGHIYYHNTKSILDVDTNSLNHHNKVDPVENLSWKRPRDGKYAVSIHQFSKRHTRDPGFTLELWANGESKIYTYAFEMKSKEQHEVFQFEMFAGQLKNLVVNKKLVSSTGSKDKWGIKTETFVPVDTLMLSPNHWDGQIGKGNKHWFFILSGCNNPEPTRGIYNEFLRSDLNEHRKVFEVLGSKTKCEPIPDSLSGLGFSSTRDDTCVVIVTSGSGDRRAYNLQF